MAGYNFITDLVNAISDPQGWTNPDGDLKFVPSSYSARAMNTNGDITYTIIIDVIPEEIHHASISIAALASKDRDDKSVTPQSAKYLLLNDDVAFTSPTIMYEDYTEHLVLTRTAERLERQYDEDKYITFPAETVTVRIEGHDCSFQFREFQYTMPRYSVPVTYAEGVGQLPWGVHSTNPASVSYYAGASVSNPGPATADTRRWLFTGWYLDKNCTQQASFPRNMPRAKDLQLYSAWRERGNIRTKVNGEWHDGYLKYKVDDQWVEADAMLVKVNGEWKEFT